MENRIRKRAKERERENNDVIIRDMVEANSERALHSALKRGKTVGAYTPEEGSKGAFKEFWGNIW